MSDFNNGLTHAQLERLAILSEELGEAQQAVGKILRHGYDSYNPHDESSPPNRQALEKELGDVRFAMRMLCETGDLSASAISRRADEKAEKIKPYLHHQ